MRTRRRLGVLVLVAGLACAGLSGVASDAGAATAGSPVGSFDGYSVSFTPPDFMQGWAADPSAPGQPITVRAYLDGRFYAAGTTGRARADVGRAVSFAGPNSGWRIPLDPTGAGLGPPGPHTMCAYAIDVGAGDNALLGCRPIPDFAPNPGNPIGSIDRVIASPGQVRLIGWAGDRNGAATTRLAIFFDSYQVNVTTNLPRADVRAAYGIGLNSGFDVTVPARPGWRGYHVSAENTGLGSRNPLIGEGTVSVPGVRAAGAHDPRGAFELLGRTSIPGGEDWEWTARGWAYDPDTSGPVTVLVRALGYAARDRPPTGNYQRRLPTGQSRPDVAVDEPAAGPASGFDGHLFTTQYVTVHYACAYAVNVGAGTTRFLGCRTSNVVLG